MNPITYTNAESTGIHCSRCVSGRYLRQSAVARQAGHSPNVALSTYAHLFEEFEVTERPSAGGRDPPRTRDKPKLAYPF